MGCVGGFNKNCDKCICLLREYGGVVKKNNFTNNNDIENKAIEKNAYICKKKLNDAFEKMNKNVKYEYESKQLKELNEIYQTLLSIESERNKTKIIEPNNNNNINDNNFVEFGEEDYDDLNKIV
jgi:hypothetical protein